MDEKITVQTIPCVHCHKKGEVVVNAAEFIRWNEGEECIQDAIPSADADTREQLITGTHPECWEKLFGKEE